MQGINPLTMKCTYATPCGWCTKWDKKCDNKIGCDTPQDTSVTDMLVNKTCKTDSDHQWECCGVSTGGDTYRCKICGEIKHEPVKYQSGLVITSL